MTAVTIRKKLGSYIQVADEKKLNALYTLLEEDIEREGRINIEQYNQQLEEAEAEFVNGDYISNVAMKENIKQW